MQGYFAGVDIGSTMTKVAITDGDRLVASVIGPTGAEHRHLANRVTEEALAKAGISFDEVAFLVATGYGRLNVPFADKQITEISCQARGTSSLFPSARTVIEIGGQDSKAIKLGGGRPKDFAMNDKCAAGTGRFIEVMAESLGLDLEEMGQLSLKAKSRVKISSTCTVFAENEVASHLSEGVALEDILSGLYEAIASRVYNMAQRLRVEPEVVFTGGGAKNIGLVKAMEEKVGYPVLIPEEPLLTVALGAALLGRDQAEREGEEALLRRRKERQLQEVTFFG